MSAEDRYGKILRRIWFDETFQLWTAPPPCAQFLWFYLCTTPRAGSIPGVFTLSIEETAKRLRWPVEDTKMVFAEILSQHRAEYDEATELLFIPSALRHDSPRNPNVVKSWRRQWAEVPPGDLKARINEAFGRYLGSLGEGFAEAWAKVAGRPASIPRNNSEECSEHSSKQFGDTPRNSFEELKTSGNLAPAIPRNSFEELDHRPENQFGETPSDPDPVTESESDLSLGGAGGAARAAREAVAREVRRELDRGRDLWPESDVPHAALAAVATRVADDVTDPMNRAAGEHVAVVRDALRAARSHKSRFKAADAEQLLAHAERAVGWILAEYRDGRRKRAGGASEGDAGGVLAAMEAERKAASQRRRGGEPQRLALALPVRATGTGDR